MINNHKLCSVSIFFKRDFLLNAWAKSFFDFRIEVNVRFRVEWCIIYKFDIWFNSNLLMFPIFRTYSRPRKYDFLENADKFKMNHNMIYQYTSFDAEFYVDFDSELRGRIQNIFIDLNPVWSSHCELLIQNIPICTEIK